MAKSSRLGGITFWAWAVSFCLHLAVLFIFSVTKFAQTNPSSSQAASSRSPLQMVNRFVDSQPIVPKPKFRNLVKEEKAEEAKKIFSINFVQDNY